MNLDPVDGREVVRCDHCKTVQFKRESQICVKCKTSYAPKAEEQSSSAVKDGSADPTTSSGESFAAQSAFPLLPQTLRQFREDLGLSQRQLAEQMKTPRTYVSKVENGKAVPTLDSLERYAVALNCSVADLVANTHQTERDPFVLEVFEGMRKLPQRQKDYIVDMVRRLATSEKRASA